MCYERSKLNSLDISLDIHDAEANAHRWRHWGP